MVYYGFYKFGISISLSRIDKTFSGISINDITRTIIYLTFDKSQSGKLKIFYHDLYYGLIINSQEFTSTIHDSPRS